MARRLDDTYRAQATLTRRLVDAIVPILVPFIGSTAPAKALAQLLFPEVVKSRRLHQALAVDDYRKLRRDAGITGEPPAASIRDYTPDALVTVIEDVRADEDPVTQEHVEQIIGRADQHARNAHRNQTRASTFADNQAIGWARVDPEPPTCPLCRLTISRGPVYKTAETAQEKDIFHPGCTCIVVPAFKGQRTSYPGSEHAAAELERYKTLTKGLSGKAAMRAYTRGVRELNGEVKPRTSAPPDGEQRAAQVRAQAENNRKAVEARIRTLEGMNPKSASAKAYVAKQLEVDRKKLAELDA
ncbi:hypothetical protein CU254_14730 [Amycolatopsis sp. AA4]|uniref:VG15 protein n=1 Tax=Actinomycetes TaxID=1760 RepID=UPI0001B54ADD|nr:MULTISPECIES: hypothetical protein [Actinomycetes]ATY11573.1 hypothetical protein CU254_14730 [Amycolatopsis sp. AA4]EFL07216.1 predicted protein [Streptomyces sp. AA4]